MFECLIRPDVSATCLGSVGHLDLYVHAACAFSHYLSGSCFQSIHILPCGILVCSLVLPEAAVLASPAAGTPIFQGPLNKDCHNIASNSENGLTCCLQKRR